MEIEDIEIEGWHMADGPPFRITVSCSAAVEAYPSEPTDAPNYGGWSAGDVMQYLERFGEVYSYPPHGDWNVFRGAYFVCDVSYLGDGVWSVFIEPGPTHTSESLPDAMQWAVERWRELVAESDPVTKQDELNAGSTVQRFEIQNEEPITRHIGTGDMGPIGVK